METGTPVLGSPSREWLWCGGPLDQRLPTYSLLLLARGTLVVRERSEIFVANHTFIVNHDGTFACRFEQESIGAGIGPLPVESRERRESSNSMFPWIKRVRLFALSDKKRTAASNRPTLLRLSPEDIINHPQ